MFCFDSIMIQFKKKSSKSVIVLLIFLTTTTHGFITNTQPSTSISADRRYRISFDRKRVGRDLPEIRNLVRRIDQKDGVYENVYDRRSFRTGTHEIRLSNVNERRLVDYRSDDRHPFRNEARNVPEGRYARDTRNTDANRNRNFRADLSRSDSVRQFRNAQVNFDRIPSGDQGIQGVRSTSRNFQIRGTSARTDSTRYLRDERNEITRQRRSDMVRSAEYRMDLLSRRYLGDSQDTRSARRRDSGTPEQRRKSERMSREIRLEHEQASQNYRQETAPFQKNSRDFRVRNILSAKIRQRNFYRTSVQGSIDVRRINLRSRQVQRNEPPADTTTYYNKFGRYIIPEGKVTTSFNSSRSGEHARQAGKSPEILEEKRLELMSSMHLKKTLSDNSCVNVAQTVLVIYIIWQILAKSSQKSLFRFHNMFSVKEKLH